MAVPSRLGASRFSVKLSVAPSNQRAPGIRSPLRSTAVRRVTCWIAEKSATASQNSAGEAMLQS
jgi:hypothetical protein